MKYGLIGEKLSHSFSVLIHSYIGNYEYLLTELGRDELADFFKKRDFCAINVTIPYKETVMQYLDFIDPIAQKIGSVNTIVNRNGILYGYNTDYYGLKGLLTRNLSDFAGKTALILGTGGTARTAKAVLSDLALKNIYTVSRNPDASQISYEQALKTDPQIIINTTPCGMFPNVDGYAIDITNFENLELVADAVYNPLRTDLILTAQKMNVKAEDGLFMLVHQAVKASELFFDTEYNPDLTDEIFGKILNRQRNIVLTGMPASGKSTVGAIISEKLGVPFYDTDTLITEKAGIPIPEIFKRYGEDEFRKLEAEVINEISNKNGVVIATGGGAVLKQDNIRHLKHNGLIFFLDRPLEELVPTIDRPLSSNAEDIKKRYFERIDIYKTTCDFRINVLTPEITAQNIIKEFSK
ncbi:MAG: shikimate dehydrogenase [Clostridiales bacterium]|nr:shikimate dehydrogenase [Candidatus Equinaster intestinalis]